MNTAESTDLDESVLILLDDEWELSCEHPHHGDEPWWHADGGLWFVAVPCGLSGFRCDKWVKSVQEVGHCRCSCAEGVAHAWPDLQVTQP